MRKSVLFCLALYLAFPFSAFASPVVMSGEAEVIMSGSREYKAIELTPEIYAATQTGLADILLTATSENGTEETIPYFINNRKTVTDSTRVQYGMKQSGSFVKDGFAYYDCELAEPPQNDILATSLHLGTTNEFVLEAELFGSYDGLVWNYVTSEKLYNVDKMNNLDFMLQPSVKYTHYRVKLPEQKDKIAFDEFILSYRAFDDSQYVFKRETKPDFESAQDGKTTVITVKGVKNLPVFRIELDSDGMFKREVSVGGYSSVIYNLRFGDKEYKSLSIEPGKVKLSDDSFKIRIDNGDDAPIDIKSLKLWYYYDELVFKAPEKGAVTLSFGNELLDKPKYDVESYKEHILAEGYDAVKLGKVTYREPEPEDKPKLNYNLILNITLVLVATALAFIIIKKLGKI